ncbi:rhodanese-like domain-containing protein [Poriferisphaera corsica]|nr:rhodanese-like domain-containing protein [Poriferisphaera corsica]
MSRSIELDNDGLPIGYPFQSEWEVTPRAVKEMIDGAAEFLFLDCRLPHEYEAAHVLNTTLIPMQELAARVEEIRDYEDACVVVMCHAGQRSLMVTDYLRQQGFEDVKSLAGGIDLWSLAIDPSIPRY